MKILKVFDSCKHYITWDMDQNTRVEANIDREMNRWTENQIHISHLLIEAVVRGDKNDRKYFWVCAVPCPTNWNPSVFYSKSMFSQNCLIDNQDFLHSDQLW